MTMPPARRSTYRRRRIVGAATCRPQKASFFKGGGTKCRRIETVPTERPSRTLLLFPPLFVMPAALGNDNLPVRYLINNTVRVVYAPTPIPLQITCKHFRLANPGKRLSIHILFIFYLYQLMDSKVSARLRVSNGTS